jgi:pimeloyl-ACP methyl ester carboxylesterase
VREWNIWVVLIAIICAPGCDSPPAQSSLAMQHETLRLQVQGGTLAYDDQGEGPLVLLLPGVGDLRQSYRFVTPELVAAGYRVVTMDLRGHGGSSVSWPTHTTSAMADDVLAVVRHLDAGPVVIVGNSLSAGTAVWAATKAPDAVNGIVMIGPFVRNQGEPSLFMKSAMALLFNGPWKVSAWTWFHGTLFPHRQPADYPTYRAQLKANLKEPGRFDALKSMMYRSDEEVAQLEASLSVLPVPSLVIMGSADPDFPNPGAEAEWIAHETGGRMALVEQAGHYPQAEMPHQVARILLEFMSQTSRPTGSK